MKKNINKIENKKKKIPLEYLLFLLLNKISFHFIVNNDDDDDSLAYLAS